MRCSPAAVLVVLAACGRLGFDPPAARTDAAAGDGTPLPAQICEMHQVAVADTGLGADLVATATPTTLTVAWGALSGSSAEIVRVGTAPFATLAGPQDLALGSATGALVALRDLGSAFELETVANGGLAITTLDAAFAPSAAPVVPAGAVGGPDCISRANTSAAWVSMYAQSSLFTARVTDDGSIGAYSTFTDPGGPLASLACDDGPDHVHVGYVVAPGNGSATCEMGSMYFASPTTFQMAPTYAVPGECDAIAVAASADANDHLLGAYRSNGGILAEWVAMDGTSTTDLAVAATGDTPRARFDGSAYWIAWTDGVPGPSPRPVGIVSYVPGGEVTPATLVDFRVLGGQAYALVRQDTRVWLVLLGHDELAFLRLCTAG